MQLPTPEQIKSELPLEFKQPIDDFRKQAKSILERRDERLAVIVGPCSIHDFDSAYEYAQRLKALSLEISPSFFPIMRFFIEKPRTKLGWKGMLYDPHLDGSNDISEGIQKSRRLFLEITKLGIPCAVELLEPLIAPYFDDLITWGLIGARTSASQPHRQLASGLDFPIGFKNDVQGHFDVALHGILASRIPHTHIGIDPKGRISALQTKGNAFTHLVLRGSDKFPNYNSVHVQEAIQAMKEHNIKPKLLIDCSHGNCGKNHKKQAEVFESVIQQARESKAIAGLMLESHIYPGKQPLNEDPKELRYGLSITDPCMGWDETEELLRSMSMSFVQN